jgi:Aldehyde dehydrogenase family
MNPLRTCFWKNSVVSCVRSFSVDSSGFNFVNGRRSSPIDTKDSIDIFEPASGRVLCTLQSSGPAEVHRAVESARKAFIEWSQVEN